MKRGFGGRAVSCKIHQAVSHPRHVKYSVYSWKWGIDLLYYIWISVFQVRVWESISKSVVVNLISNVTVLSDARANYPDGFVITLSDQQPGQRTA